VKRWTLKEVGRLRVDHGDKALFLFRFDPEGEWSCYWSWSSKRYEAIGDRFFERLKERLDGIVDEVIEELRSEEKL